MRFSYAALLLILLPGQLLADGGPPHLVQALCQNCHGVDGVAVLPGAANLSGQQREYLIEQLRAFRSGKRQNPQMTVIAKSLTEQDIEDVSLWYSSIKVTVEKPK
ncbi:MAG: cytochrome c [Burkholderiales bacterium]